MTFPHCLRGFFAAFSEPQLRSGIEAVSEKDSHIIGSGIAHAQFEVYPEQIFVFQDIFEDLRELTFCVGLCSNLSFDSFCICIRQTGNVREVGIEGAALDVCALTKLFNRDFVQFFFPKHGRKYRVNPLYCFLMPFVILCVYKDPHFNNSSDRRKISGAIFSLCFFSTRL